MFSTWPGCAHLRIQGVTSCTSLALQGPPWQGWAEMLEQGPQRFCGFFSPLPNSSCQILDPLYLTLVVLYVGG